MRARQHVRGVSVRTRARMRACVRACACVARARACGCAARVRAQRRRLPLLVRMPLLERSRTSFASMLTAATSLTTTPTRRPPLFCSNSCSIVVLPEPRKPESSEIGTRCWAAPADEKKRAPCAAAHSRAASRESAHVPREHTFLTPPSFDHCERPLPFHARARSSSRGAQTRTCQTRRARGRGRRYPARSTARRAPCRAGPAQRRHGFAAWNTGRGPRTREN